MAFSISSTSSPIHPTNLSPFLLAPQLKLSIFPAAGKSRTLTRRMTLSYSAAKQQSGPVKKRSTPSNKKRKKPVASNNKPKGSRVLEEIDEDSLPERYVPPPLPKPPAGFVVDEQGRAIMASKKRIETIVDSITNFPLECIIRRVFRTTQGDECMLLCPADAPIQVLKNTSEGWSPISDDEVESILPSIDYALAKVHMHLVHSGFCLTARGGFGYTEDDVMEFYSDDGQDVDGMPNEGIEITSFHLDGSHYMIYTPVDPLLFVAIKDKDGALKIADDELLEDPAIISAIDEETEFNALVEEEAALFESLIGKR